MSLWLNQKSSLSDVAKVNIHAAVENWLQRMEADGGGDGHGHGHLDGAGASAGGIAGTDEGGEGRGEGGGGAGEIKCGRAVEGEGAGAEACGERVEDCLAQGAGLAPSAQPDLRMEEMARAATAAEADHVSHRRA